MSYRPRRTRIYGANYDIGESYYKKQLDDLNSKNGSSRFDKLSLESKADPKEILKKNIFGSPLNMCDSGSTSQEHKIDYDIDLLAPIKTKRVTRFLDDEDDEELSSISRQFKNGHMLENMADFEFDTLDSSNKLQERKALNKFNTAFAKREISPLRSELNKKSSNRSSITKMNLSITEQGDKNDSSCRINATKARLLDLEDEMKGMADKQCKREKRRDNLKKMLAEFDSA